MSHVGRLVTDAIVTRLTDAGLTVGDGEKPATGAGWSGTPGESTYQGYVVVHPLAGGSTDGTLGDENEDAYPVYQLSTYGATRAQAENLSDLARTAMFAATLSVASRTVVQVRIDMLGGAHRVDAVQPPEWQGVERYRIWTTRN